MKNHILILLLLSQFFTVCVQTTPKITIPRPKGDVLMRAIAQPKGYVTDFEYLFNESQIKELDSLIHDFEKRTTLQIAVVTLNQSYCDKEDFEAYTLQLANTWGVGQKEKDNGILVAISKQFRQMRIHNGKGIENVLSDEETKQIIDKSFIPKFKQDHFFEGTLNGLKALIQTLDNKHTLQTKAEAFTTDLIDSFVQQKGNSQNNIDTILTPRIGGIKQVIEVKTDDLSRPILLFLSGGPGSSMMKNADRFTNNLKSRFTIVQWDQRDAGKTLALNPSTEKLTLKQMQDDTYQVINFLRAALRKEKIYLLGSSWGNVLGFHIVENHPELLHSYFAVNPVISQLASEKELLRILKDHFKENPVASQELASVNFPFTRDEDLFYLRKWLFYKEGKEFVTSNDFKSGFLQWSKSWSPVWNEVMTIDLPKTLKQIKCPVYFFVGKNDIQTSAEITRQYFKQLEPPKKDLFLFEKSHHQIHQDEPELFQKKILESLENK